MQQMPKISDWQVLQNGWADLFHLWVWLRYEKTNILNNILNHKMQVHVQGPRLYEENKLEALQ